MTMIQQRSPSLNPKSLTAFHIPVCSFRRPTPVLCVLTPPCAIAQGTGISHPPHCPQAPLDAGWAGRPASLRQVTFLP